MGRCVIALLVVLGGATHFGRSRCNAVDSSPPLLSRRFQDGAFGQWNGLLVVAGGIMCGELMSDASCREQALGTGARVDVYALGQQTPSVITSTWQGPSLPYATSHPAGAINASGTFHVTGGWGGHMDAITEHWSWDVASNASGWVRHAPLPSARGSHGCAFMPDGRMYCVGGGATEWGPYLSELQIYDPVADAWEAGPPMPTARDHVHHSTLAFLGKLWVFGGRTTHDGSGWSPWGAPPSPHHWMVSDELEVYEPETRRWSIRRPVPVARSSLMAVLHKGCSASNAAPRLLLVGGKQFIGTSSHVFSDVLEYDALKDKYYCHPPLSDAASGAAVGAMCDGHNPVIVLGGGSSGCGWSAHQRVQIYRVERRVALCGYITENGAQLPNENSKECALRWHQPLLDAADDVSRSARRLVQRRLQMRNGTSSLMQGKVIPPTPGPILPEWKEGASAPSPWQVRDDATPSLHQEGATAQWGPYVLLAGGINGTLVDVARLQARENFPSWSDKGTARVDAYNLANGDAYRGPDLPFVTNHPAGAITSNGVFHVSGGFRQDAPSALPKAWAEHWSWDVASNASGWVRHAPLPSARGSHGCAFMPDGRMYCVGGGATQWGPYLSELQIYDPVADAWEAGPPMPTARDHVQTSTVALNGLLYVFGGRTTTDRSGANCKNGECSPLDFRMVSTLEVFSSTAWRWTTGRPSPGPARGAASATPVSRLLRGKRRTTLLLAGGESFNYQSGFALRTAEEYDPETDQYHCHPPLPLQSYGAGYGFFQGTFSIVSGRSGLASLRRNVSCSSTSLKPRFPRLAGTPMLTFPIKQMHCGGSLMPIALLMGENLSSSDVRPCQLCHLGTSAPEVALMCSTCWGGSSAGGAELTQPSRTQITGRSVPPFSPPARSSAATRSSLQR